MLHADNAIMCKLCYDLVRPPNQCSCGNMGILIDDDGHWRLYVDNIKTTQRAILYHQGDFKEIRRELMLPFSEALFVNYNIKDIPFLFRDVVNRDKDPRVTSTEYDKAFIKALQRHEYRTADGNERFRRTSLQDPKKG